jgi:hypothetical protein
MAPLDASATPVRSSYSTSTTWRLTRQRERRPATTDQITNQDAQHPPIINLHRFLPAFATHRSPVVFTYPIALDMPAGVEATDKVRKKRVR